MAGRQRNTLPVAVNSLRPESQNLESIKKSLQFVKGVQKASFDNKCKSKELMPLYPTDPIQIMLQQGEEEWIPWVIVRHYEALRSYMVQFGNRQFRRHRKHVRSSAHKANETTDDQPDDWKLPVVSPPKESWQLHTSLTQAATFKTEYSDATHEASTSIISKPNTTTSRRRVVQSKK